MSDSNQSRRKFLQTTLYSAGAVVIGAGMLSQSCDNTRPTSAKYMGDFVAPKLDKIRCGFIGVGARGSGHLAWAAGCADAEVTAIADPHVPAVDRNIEELKKRNITDVKTYANGKEDFIRMINPFSVH